MDIKVALLQEHSRAQAQRIATYIGADPERFKILMLLFFNGEYRVTQRAAWALRLCAEYHPTLVLPYLSQLISNLIRPVPDAVKRNTVGLLQNISIPAELQGQLADICFNYLTGSEPIAVKASAMTILAHLAETEPDLAHELKIILHDQLPLASPGFTARARKILRKLTPELPQNYLPF